VRIAEHRTPATDRKSREDIRPIRGWRVRILEQHRRNNDEHLGAEDEPLGLDTFREAASEGHSKCDHADWERANGGLHCRPVEGRLPERDEEVEDGRPPKVRQDRDEKENGKVQIEPCSWRSERRIPSG
jgi:hypothetical protein